MNFQDISAPRGNDVLSFLPRVETLGYPLAVPMGLLDIARFSSEYFIIQNSTFIIRYFSFLSPPFLSHEWFIFSCPKHVGIPSTSLFRIHHSTFFISIPRQKP
jgi:hypothetical protein